MEKLATNNKEIKMEITNGRLPLDRTFFLHSNPKATKLIYLDFDGHVTERTSWNNRTNKALTTPQFSSDKDPKNFSDAELERIQYIWQRVAEDFAPFNINVTTEYPGNEEALINRGGKDDKWGVRVAIGGSYKDWYGHSAGGVAYINSFGGYWAGPVFVFAGNLGNGNEKYTAEAISHEAGHALGLMHDGTTATAVKKAAAYYKGQGPWAPIMGSAYSKGLSQWSQGEYADASNGQDDIAIIGSERWGAGFIADDFADTADKATLLTGPALNQFGIIGTRNDTDWFKFETKEGEVALSVSTAFQAFANDGTGNYVRAIVPGRSPNLDVIAKLIAADGSLVSMSAPQKSLGASFKVKLKAGTYYLMVDGVGYGDPVKSGYSDYGSLGGYLITGILV